MDKELFYINKNYIASFLYKARKDLNYSLEDVSRTAQINPFVLSKYEKGCKSPPAYVLLKLLEIYHVDPYFFIEKFQKTSLATDV